MPELELVSACIKNDEVAKKQLFETYYPTLGYIALRYTKNAQQADNAIQQAFKDVYSNLYQFKEQQKQTLEIFVKSTFIASLVTFVKNIRNEYYVASTVKAIENADHSYDLFRDSKFVDFRKIDESILLMSIQELVPSQRLAFNLHIIDGYNLQELSELLETSEQTVKANLEKAKFNLQKIVEKKLKLSSDGQSI